MNKISLADFHGTDMERLAAAADFLRKNSGTTLIIPEGEYTVTTELAKKQMDDVIAGRYGSNPEPIMFNPKYKYSKGFDLSGIDTATIIANGAVFMVDGFMEPLSIKNSKDITICGLTIDYKRKPYSKGIIIESKERENETKGYITIRFGEEYPLYENSPMPRWVVYSQHAGRFVDYGCVNLQERRYLGNNVFRFETGDAKKEYEGMEFYVWHTFHSRPGILIEESKNVTLDNVTIHSQPGMGIVAHRSENLEFRYLRVIPSAGEHMSTNTDATHITSCRGYLRYFGCEFEGQGDDSLNVHTYYHSIKEAEGKSCILKVEAPTGTHSQTLDHPDVGDILELTVRGTLEVADEYKVVGIKPDYENMTCGVTFEKELPEDCDNYMFANGTQCPTLTVIGCTARNHIARSVLVKTKNAVIENNIFTDIVGTAIEVAAEEWWSEGLCSTENIVIRRNHIKDCARTGVTRIKGSGGITVTMDCKTPKEKTHKNVLIEDNIIDCPDSEYAIYASNVQNLVIRRNHAVSKKETVMIK